ncbi:MAG TPA: hypothetical protein VFH92_11585 [Phenylobacterium sp.]|nr:hypothetical protein [Phenylobacterium sp.]
MTAPPTPIAEAPPAGDFALLEKARAVAAKVRRLTVAREGAMKVAHQAQVREALTRVELVEALHAALIARAETEARLRAQALETYRARRRPRPLRRHNRASQALDRVLAKLGPLGQALVIARSGVWEGGGFLAMAAYARRGADPAAQPRAFLDQAWYLARYPDVAQARVAPLVHYLLAGGREDRSPHPLFEGRAYRAANAQALAETSLTPLEHYARAGAALGASPHPLFDVAHYLAQDPALRPGEDPMAHYLREGGALGLSPHPLFDPGWQAARAAAAAGVPGLSHYLAEGWRAGLSPHPLFDPAWYLAENPHVAETGLEPLTHFLSVGAAEGRSPGPWFDLPAYAAARGEALAPGVNPLVDYLRGGAWTVVEAKPGLPTAAYVAARPDLVAAGVTPLEHWARRRAR